MGGADRVREGRRGEVERVRPGRSMSSGQRVPKLKGCPVIPGGSAHGVRCGASQGGGASSYWAYSGVPTTQRGAVAVVVRPPGITGRPLGRVQPRDCLRSRKVCSTWKRRKECLPAPVNVVRGGTSARPPRPDGFVHPAARQLLDRQADHGALDDRQWTLVVDPRGPAGQPGMEPPPCLHGRRPLPVGVGDGDRGDFAPGLGPSEHEFAALLRRATACGRQIHGTGTGLRITRSERSRPRTSVGMSVKRCAIRGAS